MPKGKRGKPPEAPLRIVEPKTEDVTPSVLAVDLSHLDPTEAVKILGELSALNDRAIAACYAYKKSRDETKDLKTKWDQLSEQVQSRLHELTHPKPMPLFHEQQAEADLARVQAQAASPDTVPF